MWSKVTLGRKGTRPAPPNDDNQPLLLQVPRGSCPVDADMSVIYGALIRLYLTPCNN